MSGHRGRCAVCFCPADFHDHYTASSDTRCGTCGPPSCPAYVDPAKRWPRLTPDQRTTREIALERIHINTVALLPFVSTTRRPAPQPLPIPAQRQPSPVEQVSPGQQAALQRALASQARNRGNKPKRRGGTGP